MNKKIETIIICGAEIDNPYKKELYNLSINDLIRLGYVDREAFGEFEIDEFHKEPIVHLTIDEINELEMDNLYCRCDDEQCDDEQCNYCDEKEWP